MNPYKYRQWMKSRAVHRLTDQGGRVVCTNLNKKGDRPPGTAWVWDDKRGRPQLMWLHRAIASSAGS